MGRVQAPKYFGLEPALGTGHTGNKVAATFVIIIIIIIIILY